MALDVSEEMIDRARGGLADLGNVRLVVGNGTDLHGIPDGSVDVAYSFIVFQHTQIPR